MKTTQGDMTMSHHQELKPHIKEAAKRALQLYKNGASTGKAIGIADAEFLDSSQEFSQMVRVFNQMIGRGRSNEA